MKVIVNNEVMDYRTVWMKSDTLHLINQPLLPHSFEIYESRDYRKTAEAIRDMIVRGAPAIGATTAFGMTQAVLQSNPDFQNQMDKAADLFREMRPTAYDLFHAVDFIMGELRDAGDINEAREIAVRESQRYADESAERCRKIGEVGEKLLEDGMTLLTHCNAGALGCVDYGTALAPVRLAHYNNKELSVYVDETRPRMQGSRLTAWELQQEGIEHYVIADNAAGYLMWRGEIDLVIVGADRIASNGDVANKIGTYEKAVLAKENNIPFYVAAPESTMDYKCNSGKQIEIEERDSSEVLCMFGLDAGGKISSVRVSPKGSKARNPAFDITPAELVTGIITEKGVYKPDRLRDFKS